MALLIGDEFNSFEQFQQALIAYKNAKFMDFAISDCSKKNLSKKILPKVKNIILQNHESDHIIDEENDLPEYTEPSDEKIAIGSFVLVKVQSGKTKSTNFAIDTTRQSFKLVENDLFTVDLQDIIALLNTSKIKTSGNRVRYKFSHSIDIKED
ncbi:protein FAR1-RELATED SEQUENCE 12-like [Aphis craccivora]|uniref:Protein FAR1-RELATED SEQUENCE 12-like n=1 Tax=Aphis craccivora TaxID=307492 RepID=A0A6G0ZKD2_APHCR|nr:protein FAR1-RELATED SEQUENCE 12-like [Aphis craccivora]